MYFTVLYFVRLNCKQLNTVDIFFIRCKFVDCVAL